MNSPGKENKILDTWLADYVEGVNPVELYPFGDDADVFWDEYIRGLDPAGFVFNDEVDEGLNASEPVLANIEDTGTIRKRKAPPEAPEPPVNDSLPKWRIDDDDSGPILSAAGFVDAASFQAIRDPFQSHQNTYGAHETSLHFPQAHYHKFPYTIEGGANYPQEPVKQSISWSPLVHPRTLNLNSVIDSGHHSRDVSDYSSQHDYRDGDSSVFSYMPAPYGSQAGHSSDYGLDWYTSNYWVGTTNPTPASLTKFAHPSDDGNQSAEWSWPNAFAAPPQSGGYVANDQLADDELPEGSIDAGESFEGSNVASGTMPPSSVSSMWRPMAIAPKSIAGIFHQPELAHRPRPPLLHQPLSLPPVKSGGPDMTDNAKQPPGIGQRPSTAPPGFYEPVRGGRVTFKIENYNLQLPKPKRLFKPRPRRKSQQNESFRACPGCQKIKKKCIREDPQQDCARCSKMGLECPVTRPAALEEGFSGGGRMVKRLKSIGRRLGG